MPDFLLEIGLEEVPARMIDAAEVELSQRVSDLLARERLNASTRVTGFSTPRRLSVLATGIAAAQPDAAEQVLGPSIKVAFKDGQPTPAALAFAKKVGVDVGRLLKVEMPKGEYLGANVVDRGRAAAEVLAETLPKEILSLYWPKNMYWRSKSERFVRPVRWLVAMLDGEVVPMELAGKPAQKGTYGHRILAGATTVHSAAEYARTLEGVKVIVSRQARLERIRKALDAATRAVPGARWREDADLLDTVVNLTEWPSVILGNFDREFLSLPEEVLVTVMRDHQKYFAVEDASGKLAPHFLAVLNTDGDPNGIIRHGNERVLRARFNDARFFWETDQKISLRDRVPLLKAVTFQKDLGSYYDKTVRLQELSARISQRLGDSGMQVRPGVVHKASWLAKADLTTELVKEFTELQGIVGGLYAKVQQLDPSMPEATRQAIGDAIYDHYKPESMEDRVPRTFEAAIVSIADKADSIAGMFALGLQPTGSKDPFALRRQAN
ncbi:MAG: glycine--tRNA ligase subunit beta, partial [Acidobacteria bacterium]|nr:glycine--tRNA ligase subunit beta [Acidobacteriota bacterium]